MTESEFERRLFTYANTVAVKLNSNSYVWVIVDQRTSRSPALQNNGAKRFATFAQRSLAFRNVC